MVQSHDLPGLLLPTMQRAYLLNVAILDDRIYFVHRDHSTKQTYLEIYRFSFAADNTLQIVVDSRLLLEPRYNWHGTDLQFNRSFLFVQNTLELGKLIIDAYDLNEIHKGTSPLKPRHSFKRIAIAAQEEVRSEDSNQRGAVYVFDCDPHSGQFGQLDLELDSTMPRNVGYFGSRLIYFDERLIVGQESIDTLILDAAIFEFDTMGTTVNTVDVKVPMEFRLESVSKTATRRRNKVFLLKYFRDKAIMHAHAQILSLEDSPSFSGEHATPKITEGL
jgi:hypothetical protein